MESRLQAVSALIKLSVFEVLCACDSAKLLPPKGGTPYPVVSLAGRIVMREWWRPFPEVSRHDASGDGGYYNN